MNTSVLYYLWLNLALSAGSKASKSLLERFDSIEEVYNASREDYAALDIADEQAEKLCDKSLAEANRIAAWCEKEHIGILCYADSMYPGRLRALDDPPPVLYYRGRLELLDTLPVFAMVGTRSCSEHGFRTAYRLAFDVANAGGCIINGLALGIDAAALTGCLDAGGYAIGVLGCGIDRIYPSQNKELFHRLSRQGLIISEFPPFSRPLGAHFPVRNRVISALAIGVAVFEGEAGSGALITASHALEQGKKLFAVPGNADDKLNEGPLFLIKNGAGVLTEATDMLVEYTLAYPDKLYVAPLAEFPDEKCDAAVKAAFAVNPAMVRDKTDGRRLPKPAKAPKSAPKPVREAPKSSKASAEKPAPYANAPDVPAPQEAEGPAKDTSVLSAEEKRVYALFEKHRSLSADDIVESGVSPGDALASLTLLEVYGFIESLPGGRYRIL